jgi:hypothetical protein
MAKHTVVFEETVTYEVEVEIPEGVAPEWEDGDGFWFALLDVQYPEWVTKSSTSVEGRTVLMVDGRRPEEE